MHLAIPRSDQMQQMAVPWALDARVHQPLRCVPRIQFCASLALPWQAPLSAWYTKQQVRRQQQVGDERCKAAFAKDAVCQLFAFTVCGLHQLLLQLLPFRFTFFQGVNGGRLSRGDTAICAARTEPSILGMLG